MTRDEADRAARAARAELGDSWLLIDMNLDGVVDCYAVDLEPQWGTIAVIGRDDGSSADENPMICPHKAGVGDSSPSTPTK